MHTPPPSPHPHKHTQTHTLTHPHERARMGVHTCTHIYTKLCMYIKQILLYVTLPLKVVCNTEKLTVVEGVKRIPQYRTSVTSDSKVSDIQEQPASKMNEY